MQQPSWRPAGATRGGRIAAHAMPARCSGQAAASACSVSPRCLMAQQQQQRHASWQPPSRSSSSLGLGPAPRRGGRAGRLRQAGRALAGGGAAAPVLAAAQGDPQQPIRPQRPPVMYPYKMLRRRWHEDPRLDLPTLHQMLLRNCQQGRPQLAPLQPMMALATTPADAALVLDALRAARLAYAQQQGLLRPLPPSIAARFLRMVAATSAVEVLVAAMQQPVELGLAFSRKKLHAVMQHWGRRGRLRELESIAEAMPAAGVAHDHTTAYILVRTAWNVGQRARARQLADHFSAQGLRMKPATLRLIGAEAEAAAGPAPGGAGGAAGAGAAAAAGGVAGWTDDEGLEAGQGEGGGSWEEAGGGGEAAAG